MEEGRKKQKKKKIVIVAESGADITQEYIDQYGLVIVPMYVTMGKDTFPDGSFPVTDLFEYYDKTGKLPQTSAPSPGDYEEAFGKIHKKYPEAEILHLCYSKVTSCSYQNSVIAGENMSFVTHIRMVFVPESL